MSAKRLCTQCSLFSHRLWSLLDPSNFSPHGLLSCVARLDSCYSVMISEGPPSPCKASIDQFAWWLITWRHEEYNQISHLLSPALACGPTPNLSLPLVAGWWTVSNLLPHGPHGPVFIVQAVLLVPKRSISNPSYGADVGEDCQPRCNCLHQQAT